MRDWAPGANRVLARGFVAGIPGFESCAPQEFALLGHVDGTERKHVRDALEACRSS
jgi:hypothetical protein